ncbi:hypothetical protein ERJ75_001658600 [Trypanosoma vivax]|uniref:Uncharacterized protein n=1 Tax=Trypanosoma vivax (strain Y486) TaxID=1055687 RepID=G0U8C1_TRYVY|nr:hypothetical protein TRVL_03154 [Trypanosoma vivax]KAH8605065.1 hypothetical protein ERJ75_001658600 [Trypanosoma vivax]CCC53844.1 conserved hypothetical protein [Trypanosoma vivax Y486]
MSVSFGSDSSQHKTKSTVEHMVRCKVGRSTSLLVLLHVSVSFPEPDCAQELDIPSLCTSISERIRFLGGLAVEALEERLSLVEAVRGTSSSIYDGNGRNTYQVVVRLAHASPLAVEALRAACASMMQGVLLAEKKGSKTSGTHGAQSVPVAVRVLKLTADK